MSERILKLVIIIAALMVVVPFASQFWTRVVSVDARGFSSEDHGVCDKCGHDYYPTELQWIDRCVICNGKITRPQQ